MMQRYYKHQKRKREGFHNPTIDRYAYGDLGKYAIRGREQQLIDFYGGIGNARLGNLIRGVSPFNPAGRMYHRMSNKYFGNIAPYTGWL